MVLIAITFWQPARQDEGKRLVANLFVLLSHERSGSHLVGEFLKGLTDFKVFDEVCNPDAVKPERSPESFFRFKYESIVRTPWLLLNPTRQGHAAFVDAYFEHLLVLRAPHHVAVDIKYGHVQNFEGWWWPMLERPALLKYCETGGIGIVHLFRENVVEATVSSMIADKRKVWHSWEAAAEPTADLTFSLPVQEVIHRAKLLEEEIRWFREWTGKNRRIEITYERVSVELGREGPLDAELTGFLGQTPRMPFRPRHRKLTRPLREVLENFAELKSACDVSGLGSLVL